MQRRAETVWVCSLEWERGQETRPPHAGRVYGIESTKTELWRVTSESCTQLALGVAGAASSCRISVVRYLSMTITLLLQYM